MRALSSMLSGVSACCTLAISSGSSMTKLICAFLGAQHCAWKCPSLLQLKHLHGGHRQAGAWLTCAAFPCICWLRRGACARLLMSIGTGMLCIHGGVLEEFT